MSNQTRADKERISSAQQQKLENELFDRASRITPEEAQKVEYAATEKFTRLVTSANSNSSAIRRLLSNVATLIAMLRDKDFSLEWQVKAVIAAALAYFVMPVDLFPDFIPLVGYVDDAFVLSFVLNIVGEEILRYKQFKRK